MDSFSRANRKRFRISHRSQIFSRLREPDNPTHHYYLALALKKSGDLDGCRAELVKVLDLNPGDALALRELRSH